MHWSHDCTASTDGTWLHVTGTCTCQQMSANTCSQAEGPQDRFRHHTMAHGTILHAQGTMLLLDDNMLLPVQVNRANTGNKRNRSPRKSSRAEAAGHT